MKASTRSVESKISRNRRSRFGGVRKHYLEALESRQLLSGTVTPPVQTFYLPFPAASVYQALHTIHPDAQAPISTYASIVVAEDNTRIFYDQWENGFAADISQPMGSEVYDSATNPAGVQIWGDGDLSNGAAPGFDGDMPHEPRGCFAQAWSVAEVLRVLREELGSAPQTSRIVEKEPSAPAHTSN